jgi:hypothetical protein
MKTNISDMIEQRRFYEDELAEALERVARKIRYVAPNAPERAIREATRALAIYDDEQRRNIRWARQHIRYWTRKIRERRATRA